MHCDEYPYWFMESFEETIKDSKEDHHGMDSADRPRQGLHKWLEEMIERCL